MKHEQTIYGLPPSKPNAYKFGRGGMWKTDAVKKWEQKFYEQCTYRERNIKNFFELYLDVFYPNRRQDLDNVLKGVLDCLQTCRAIENDRWCVKIVAQRFIDPVQPRIEFTLKEVEGIEVRPTRQPDLFDKEP